MVIRDWAARSAARASTCRPVGLGLGPGGLGHPCGERARDRDTQRRGVPGMFDRMRGRFGEVAVSASGCQFDREANTLVVQPFPIQPERLGVGSHGPHGTSPAERRGLACHASGTTHWSSSARRRCVIFPSVVPAARPMGWPASDRHDCKRGVRHIGGSALWLLRLDRSNALWERVSRSESAVGYGSAPHGDPCGARCRESPRLRR